MNSALKFCGRWLALPVLLALQAPAFAQIEAPLIANRYFTDPKAIVFVDGIQRGNMKRVVAGLDEGIPPNALGVFGYRPIHFAFYPTSSIDVLEKLLDAGADPNAALSNANRPIHLAVKLGNPKFVEMLLDAHVDPNARGERNEPPLHMALPARNPKMIEVLAAGGADLDSIWSSVTPLYASIASMNWAVATSLTKLGAENKFKDAQGRDATDLLCSMISRFAPDDVNRPGVSALLSALSKRSIPVPCAPAVAIWK